MLEAVADLLGDDLRFHHAKLNSKLPGRARHSGSAAGEWSNN